MPSDQLLTQLQTQLHSLATCILCQAQKDRDFANELASILGPVPEKAAPQPQQLAQLQVGGVVSASPESPSEKPAAPVALPGLSKHKWKTGKARLSLDFAERELESLQVVLAPLEGTKGWSVLRGFQDFSQDSKSWPVSTWKKVYKELVKALQKPSSLELVEGQAEALQSFASKILEGATKGAAPEKMAKKPPEKTITAPDSSEAPKNTTALERTREKESNSRPPEPPLTEEQSEPVQAASPEAPPAHQVAEPAQTQEASREPETPQSPAAEGKKEPKDSERAQGQLFSPPKAKQAEEGENSSPTRPDFPLAEHPLAWLQEAGEAAFREELKSYPEAELRKIGRAEGLKKAGSKSMKAPKIIDGLLRLLNKRLKKGSSFGRVGIQLGHPGRNR